MLEVHPNPKFPLATAFFTCFAFWQAFRAGPLLAKVERSGGSFGDVVKQLGKKHGKAARSFFARYATDVAGNTDVHSLVGR